MYTAISYNTTLCQSPNYIVRHIETKTGCCLYIVQYPIKAGVFWSLLCNISCIIFCGDNVLICISHCHTILRLHATNFKITITIIIFPYKTLMFIYRPKFFAHNYLKHIITDFATSEVWKQIMTDFLPSKKYCTTHVEMIKKQR